MGTGTSKLIGNSLGTTSHAMRDSMHALKYMGVFLYKTLFTIDMYAGFQVINDTNWQSLILKKTTFIIG